MAQMVREVASKTTLGPKGRNVVMENSIGAPTVSKDGVTVLRALSIGTPIHQRSLILWAFDLLPSAQRRSRCECAPP